MGCTGCGGQPVARAVRSARRVRDGKMVLVAIHGHSDGVRRPLYGASGRNYAMRMNGDTAYVLQEDQHADPAKFVLVPHGDVPSNGQAHHATNDRRRSIASLREAAQQTGIAKGRRGSTRLP